MTGERSTTKTEKMLRIELEQGRDIDELLIDLKYIQGLTDEQIGARISVPGNTVNGWLRLRQLDPKTVARKALEAAS